MIDACGSTPTPPAGGWFVDATPADDSEFTTPGNQGEMNRRVVEW